jgi:hypothetical protein
MWEASILFLSIGVPAIMESYFGKNISNAELESYLQSLESELRKIPRWMDVVTIMSEIRKVKTELNNFKMLEKK